MTNLASGLYGSYLSDRPGKRDVLEAFIENKVEKIGNFNSSLKRLKKGIEEARQDELKMEGVINRFFILCNNTPVEHNIIGMKKWDEIIELKQLFYQRELTVFEMFNKIKSNLSFFEKLNK